MPPLPTGVPGLPPTVTAVIATALAKDFRQRFESVQAFADALERAYRFGTMPTPALQTSDSTTPPSERDVAQRREQPREGRKRISRRAALIGGGSVVALAAVGGAYLGWLALAPKKTLVTRITLLSPSPTLMPSPTPTPTATAPASAIGDTVYVYTGHSNWVDTANWSPNGQRIVSASFDQTLHVWDALTGQHELKQHDYAYATGGEGAVWSPDGTSIASNRSDRTVRVWDAATQKQKLSVSGSAPIAWSPNGKRIVSGDAYSNIFLWEAATGQTILTYRKHSGNIYSVRWSPNGKFIASCAEDTTVQVWKATD